MAPMSTSKVVGIAPSPARADDDLVGRFRQGDLGAFEEIYRRHAGRLYSLACRMTGNPSDGEDLLQDIFVQVHRKLTTFKGESALATWLYRLAMNVCLDHLRSRGVRMDQVSDSIDADGDPTPPADRGMEAALVVNRIDLERAIARLPEGSRAAFLLHDVEGFEHQEVAAILGIAEGTSKSQVHKARLRLRRWLHAAH